jgi:phosphoglycolate phosphatase-like HAD superfamily hydrolase
VPAVALDLDLVLGDTRALWEAWVADAERRYRVELGSADEETLDERIGNWRPLLERFAEEHAPVYMRPNAEANAALRRLRAAGVSVVAVTPAPKELAHVALAQLGAARLVDAVVSRAPDGAKVLRSRDDLLVESEAWSAKK